MGGRNVGRWWRRSRRVGGGWRLGGAHERAAHDDPFAARRDVRELLFDMSFVDGVITLEDALALGGTALRDERPLPACFFFSSPWFASRLRARSLAVGDCFFIDSAGV